MGDVGRPVTLLLAGCIGRWAHNLVCCRLPLVRNDRCFETPGRMSIIDEESSSGRCNSRSLHAGGQCRSRLRVDESQHCRDGGKERRRLHRNRRIAQGVKFGDVFGSRAEALVSCRCCLSHSNSSSERRTGPLLNNFSMKLGKSVGCDFSEVCLKPTGVAKRKGLLCGGGYSSSHWEDCA